jgi:ubiquinone/menaquinone biosynthesis C-methylase UbiE
VQTPRSTEELQAYYAARAPEYDRVYTKPERQHDLRAIERWIAPLFAGKSILELACGTGYWTQFLAPAAQAVVAVDASLETLQIAKSRVTGDHVQFTVGDAYRLPVDRGSFDGGFAGFWISHVPRVRMGEFLREFHRALKPGTKAVLLDNRFVPGSSTAIAEQDKEGNTYQLRRLEDGSTHRVLKNFPSQIELRQELAQLASEIRFHEWQYYWAIEYVVAAL